jgi:hypothetical protein
MSAATDVDSALLASDDVRLLNQSRSSRSPYLSVVVTARNDNHGGDLIPRMQTFASALAAQCERHRIESELILVDWNPPGDRPRLAEALEWPHTPWCVVRVIEVPHELHARLEHGDRLPIFQMIAKNVGVRRARGEYVLATNVDIILSDELMEEIRPGRLRRDRFYRVDRLDTDIVPEPEAGIEETLQHCRNNVIRVCGRMGTLDLRTGTFYRIYEDQRLPLTVRRVLRFWRAVLRRVGRVGAALRRVAAALRRVAAALLHALADCIRLVVFLTKALVALVEGSAREPSTRSIRHELQWFRTRLLRRAWALRRLAVAHRRRFGSIDRSLPLRIRDWASTSLHELGASYERMRVAWEAEKARIPLHTNASGDFTLLARAAWERTRAYPELEIFSMHLDGLFLYQAHYVGLSEKTLRGAIYHIEHTHGFKPDPEEVDTLNARLEHASIPQVSNDQFLRWIQAMHKTRAPIAFNDDGWGFADEVLPERVPDKSLEAATAP